MVVNEPAHHGGAPMDWTLEVVVLLIRPEDRGRFGA
jgi:hypothetical protein